MPDDRIQREIEDILNKLDEFVPEKRTSRRIQRRSSEAAAAFGRAVLGPIARISLSHVMLAALALIFIAFFGMRVRLPFAFWVLIGGLILFGTAFALSFVSRGAPETEKRWRGRAVDYDEPSLGDRLRAWFKSKRRPPN